MRSLLEAFFSADGGSYDAHGAGELSGSRPHVRAHTAASPDASPRRPEALPILALCPTGDGTALTRALARVLVRRALVQEGAIGSAGDCTKPTRSG